LKDNNNTNVLFALASLYQRLSQYKEAKIHYKKLLTVDPDYKKALNNYLVLMSEESPGQALTELKEMERVNPDFSPIQAQIGMIYAQMGDYASAEKYLHRSIILAPEVLHYRYNLAVVYDNMKKYSEAIAVYKQILDAGGASEVLPQNSNSIRNRMTYLQEKLAIHRE
jgi:tetratricopeptide (TPR) repeat protein